MCQVGHPKMEISKITCHFWKCRPLAFLIFSFQLFVSINSVYKPTLLSAVCTSDTLSPYYTHSYGFCFNTGPTEVNESFAPGFSGARISPKDFCHIGNSLCGAARFSLWPFRNAAYIFWSGKKYIAKGARSFWILSTPWSRALSLCHVTFLLASKLVIFSVKPRNSFHAEN